MPLRHPLPPHAVAQNAERSLNMEANSQLQNNRAELERSQRHQVLSPTRPASPTPAPPTTLSPHTRAARPRRFQTLRQARMAQVLDREERQLKMGASKLAHVTQLAAQEAQQIKDLQQKLVRIRQPA